MTPFIVWLHFRAEYVLRAMSLGFVIHRSVQLFPALTLNHFNRKKTKETLKELNENRKKLL